jgi:signal transduction histidine kinase
MGNFFEAFGSEQDQNAKDVLILNAEDDEILFRYFPEKKTILRYPIFSELKQLICVFLVADSETKELSRLSEPTFKNSVVSLLSQLAIAYSHHDRALQDRRMRQLWSSFLESNFSTSKCFNEMARQVPSFLPTFGPIRYRGSLPGVQILMLSHNPDPNSSDPELVIRGTTGVEPEGTRIAIERSITGLLFSCDKRELPYFCDDPAKPEYRKRYRKYLGQGGACRTELAVRLLHNNATVGVLNLESDTLDAFNIHHVSALLRLSEIITPILMFFERRLELNNNMQISVASSTARYLEGIASVYRHSIATPLATLRSNIELTSDIVKTDTLNAAEKARALAAIGETVDLLPLLDQVVDSLKTTDSIFKRLLAVHSQISKYNDDFLDDVSSYAEAGPTDLRATLNATIKLVTDSLLSRVGRLIRIEVIEDKTSGEARVYSSPLLKQHLYNLLHNSVLAIQHRQRGDPRPGVISIEISKEFPPPSQEVKLNRSWTVRIRDNGVGVQPNQLAKLSRFQPGVRFRADRGIGFGLVAAQRFIASMGGRIALNSVFGEFFEVTLYIQEYNSPR